MTNYLSLSIFTLASSPSDTKLSNAFRFRLQEGRFNTFYLKSGRRNPSSHANIVQLSNRISRNLWVNLNLSWSICKTRALAASCLASFLFDALAVAKAVTAVENCRKWHESSSHNYRLVKYEGCRIRSLQLPVHSHPPHSTLTLHS
jgi:hypothetical protein